MIKYIHGSENSTDVDVHYVFNELPDLATCKKFCSEDPTENRNIITIANGVVTGCYKGTIDEVNNGLLATYPLHMQDDMLLVTRKLPRLKGLKYIRAVRGMLSHISRSQYRTQVKAALRGSFREKLGCLLSIDISTIDFSTLNNNMTDLDIAKVYAFQIGQSWALMDGLELYTKNEVACEFQGLSDFVNRVTPVDLNTLNTIKNMFIMDILERVKFIDNPENRTVFFPDENITIELEHETIVK